MAVRVFLSLEKQEEICHIYAVYPMYIVWTLCAASIFSFYESYHLVKFLVYLCSVPIVRFHGVFAQRVLGIYLSHITEPCILADCSG